MDPQQANSFELYDEGFNAIIGSRPKVEVLLEKSYPFAHEAGVFIPDTNELFITSNQLLDGSGQRRVQITKVKIRESGSVPSEEIHCPGIVMANGGVNYEKDRIIICSQGDEVTPSGLYTMQISPPYSTEPLVVDFRGRPFNSLNDVVVHSDGSVWFTDPCYGHDQGFKPRPRLPNQVYRYVPSTHEIRVVADGFGRPNGICFSPDESTVYITDTDWTRGAKNIDDSRSSTIYAFDVKLYSGRPFLINRRVFDFVATGIPDGIKCDTAGNVYSGCGDGVHVWSSGGVFLGKILARGGVSNFCFGRGGEMYLLNERRLLRVALGKRSQVRGALLKL